MASRTVLITRLCEVMSLLSRHLRWSKPTESTVDGVLSVRSDGPEIIYQSITDWLSRAEFDWFSHAARSLHGGPDRQSRLRLHQPAADGHGGAEFNNLYRSSNVEAKSDIDFVALAAAMGAHAVKAKDIAGLEAEILAARDREIPSVIVIDTDPMHGPGEAGGGPWWDVAVPEVSARPEVKAARDGYVAALKDQRVAD